MRQSKKQMTKTYNSHLRKRELQRCMYNNIKRTRAVCLAGPDVDVYLGLLPKEIKDIKIYEKDIEMVIMQIQEMQSMQRKGVVVTCGDIYDAPIDKGAFYDLDFCVSIRTVTKIINKFKDCAFSVTLSLRPTGMGETIRRFFEALGEKLLIDIPWGKDLNKMKTDKNEYIYTTYGGTNNLFPMLTIFKLH